MGHLPVYTIFIILYFCSDLFAHSNILYCQKLLQKEETTYNLLPVTLIDKHRFLFSKLNTQHTHAGWGLRLSADRLVAAA